MNLRIRQLRNEHGLKQSEIADVLSCDQSLYSKYERGLRPLPLDSAVFLAKYYHVSLDYLTGLSEQRQTLSAIF